MSVPTNHPSNHNNKKDLCIIPPATAIRKKRIIERVFIDDDLISTSVNRLTDAASVTHQKTARGPNGWVNSWCVMNGMKRKAVSIPKITTSITVNQCKKQNQTQWDGDYVEKE